MQKRTIGPLLVSPIGMGCMGLSHGYGAIPEKSYSLEAIRKAYAFGCTFFDTAEAYGPNLLPEHRGHNELLLGEALKDFRSQVVLATKLHLEAEEVAAKGVVQSIREHLLASLKRLATDYVD
ncbi:MAG: aldo/keto reductase, partial [Desulfovibrio sp.]|nr:aldo/keto reductase [Desulfovibrio sp.]